MEARLQKILAQRGIASRRKAEEMILAGQVRLNGEMAYLGQKADPECDRIEVQGQLIQPQHQPLTIYLLLHKPAGVVSTCHDPWQRPTILDLLPPHFRQEQGLHPVGRLDINTTGALLITNDGRLTFELTHPRHHVPKTYQVWVQGNPTPKALQQWRQGVMLLGQRTLPAQVRIWRPYQPQQNQTGLEVILEEGKKRQIRRVAEQLGYPVLHLHRSKIGPISLKVGAGHELPQGHYRVITPMEVDGLRHMIKTKSCAVEKKECLV